MPVIAAVAVVAEVVGAVAGVELAAGAIGSAVLGGAVAESSVIASAVGGAVLGAGTGALTSAVTGGNVLQGAALGALTGGIGSGVAPIIGEAVSGAIGAGSIANGVTTAISSLVGGTAGGLAQGQDFGEAMLNALPGALGAGMFVGSGLKDLLSETVDGFFDSTGDDLVDNTTTDWDGDGRLTNRDVAPDIDGDGRITEADADRYIARYEGDEPVIEGEVGEVQGPPMPPEDNATISERVQAQIDAKNAESLNVPEGATPTKILDLAREAANRGVLEQWANNADNANAWNTAVKSGLLVTEVGQTDFLDEVVAKNNAVRAARPTFTAPTLSDVSFTESLYDPAEVAAITKSPQAIFEIMEANRPTTVEAKAPSIYDYITETNKASVQAAERAWNPPSADTLTAADRTLAQTSAYEKLQNAATRNQEIIEFYQSLDQKTMLPTEKANLADALQAQDKIISLMGKYEPTIAQAAPTVDYSNYGMTGEVVQAQSAPVTPQVVDASGFDPLAGRSSVYAPTQMVSNPNAYGMMGEQSFYGGPLTQTGTVGAPSSGAIGSGDVAGFLDRMTADAYQSMLAQPNQVAAAPSSGNISIPSLTIQGPGVTIPSGTGVTTTIPTITPTPLASLGTGTGTTPPIQSATSTPYDYTIYPNFQQELEKQREIALAGTGTTPGGTYTGTLNPAGGRSLGDMSGLNFYSYGMGSENPFYRAPAAAKGGYFDADAYFAEGGLVAPPKPPVQPTVAAYPTMAYTDGQGLVGAVSAPPALTPYDMFGSDAPHASPMAPAPAAAAPTMTPDSPLLAMRNVNATPVAAPISQNPNLGYSLGMSPLSRLKG
jgi:hypothetical protein